MSRSIKQLLLCLAAAAAMTVSGTVYAEDTTENTAADTAAEEEKPAEKAKRTETKEKAELSAEDAEKYLDKIGSADGFDVYHKDKDFDDALWEKAGGKPENKKDYTEEQQLLADKITSLKKLGELVIIDKKTGNAAASFKSGSKCSDGKFWLSEAGRFFIVTDEKASKVVRLRQIISSLDSSCAFLSEDRRTLELLDRDMKGNGEVFRFGGTEDGRRVYKSDKGFAWVTEDKKHFLGAFRYGAENDELRMIIDDRSAVFGIEVRKTGYIWWSSPLEASQDRAATGLLAEELRSSNMLRYGVPLSRSGNNVLRSGSDSDCKFTVSDIKDGIRIVYDYNGAGFSVPVEYTLEGDHLRAAVKVSEIKETKSSNVATEMTVLGSFGAASDKEEGYFVVPDGCGALIRFNNNRSFQNNIYQQRVYGGDVTAVPQTRGAVTEQIYLPVYGIVKEDNALLAVAAKGDSNAYLTANVSKQSNSSYNICNFTFVLRGTDSFYMSGSSNERYTVFESGGIKSDDIEMLYYPISEKGADYADIAARYRQYLLEEQGVRIRSRADDVAVYLRLYGGVMKKKPILGIPVAQKTSVTGYGQAADIISSLSNGGVDNMVVSYKNWTDDGIRNKVDTDAKPSGRLGGKKDFGRLTGLMEEKGFSFYPVSDNRDFCSGNGYYSFTDTAVRISGSYSRIMSYDRAYGIPNGFRKNMSLLSPRYFGRAFGDIEKNYSKKGLKGVSLSSLTTSLYGDYGKKSISRAKAETMLEEGFSKLDGSLGEGILAEGANAYALPYVSRISDVPVSSSRFDLFDEDIPFYQMVLHGVIPYSAEAVNSSPDPEKLALLAAASGSCISFDMICEDADVLKDTEFDGLYYANHRYWTETAAKEYSLLEPMLASVSDSFITDYTRDGNTITTVYSNGTETVTDLDECTVSWQGGVIDLNGIS
ncbi:DUF5696 domain-containing protein [Ruminococcus flavefaciens]|uniref:DUF5057 domain-containing protein n=1 Tax=Ruminococcus flavefaciens 007c TaxID=1341157 RepID=W7UFS5_RUMFL|nr:DUF5696 domain-containing protein [Ruminococcus flavefaciens]EWM52783.1 hypothetical protein RF007C_14290 [Ruminococcus flavefaciens 007c]